MLLKAAWASAYSPRTCAGGTRHKEARGGTAFNLSNWNYHAPTMPVAPEKRGASSSRGPRQHEVRGHCASLYGRQALPGIRSRVVASAVIEIEQVDDVRRSASSLARRGLPNAAGVGERRKSEDRAAWQRRRNP